MTERTRRILKFTLGPWTNVITADEPRCLAVGVQGDDIVLWAEASIGDGVITRFVAVPTGQDAPGDDSAYIGTAQLPGPLVFHVYRLTRS